MAPTVTREFLLEGIVRAAHAARSFLKDAILLYENHRLASAYITGVIAIEQLGRANWMLGRHADMMVNSLSSLDCATFAKELRNVSHNTTLRHGILSAEIKTTPEMLALTEQLQTLHSKSPEFAVAAKTYRELFAKVFADNARDYHSTRMEVQYVNPDSTCSAWTSPLLVTQEQVKTLLRDAGTHNRVMFTLIGNRSDVMQIVDRIGIRQELENFQHTWLPEEWPQIAAKEAAYRGSP